MTDKRDPPVKPCLECFTYMHSARKICLMCGHQSYRSKKDKREDPA